MTISKKKKAKSKTVKSTKKPVVQEVEIIETIPEVIIETPSEPAEEATNAQITKLFKKANKLALMVEMLSKPEGETLKKLAETLGWKENSVRGAMSLYAKQHKEYLLISEKIQGIRTYRLSKVIA